jgi:hypothetical protein
MNRDEAREEQHPLFPTGEWEGFYVYRNQKHKMNFLLEFTNGEIRGRGTDGNGVFSWRGSYNKEELYCEMSKRDSRSQTVWYQGEVDENGIWGIWLHPPFGKGGFHIWPKRIPVEAEIAETRVRKKAKVVKW